MFGMIFGGVVLFALYLLFLSPERMRTRILNRYRTILVWLKEFGSLPKEVVEKPKKDTPLPVYRDYEEERTNAAESFWSKALQKKRRRPRGEEICM